jgi:transcriptional regulator with XRE-family HTH domain
MRDPGERIMKALIIGNLQHHTEETFWSTFIDDVRGAQSLIIIACPYVRIGRLRKLLPEFETLRSRGVQVCVILQDPSSWTNPDDEDDVAPAEISQQSREDFNNLVVKLQSKGVHVLIRRFSHQKIVIIDGTISWSGSLNVLSHTGKTYEHMTRFDCVQTAAWLVDAHNLNCPICKEQFEKPLRWFGKQFEKCRDADGLTQVQVAEILGIDQTTVSKIERGERNLKLDKLIKYANQMGWNVRFVPSAQSNKSHTSSPVSRLSIGQNLQECRLSQKLSRCAVANSVGMTENGLAKIEKGKSNPTLSTLLAIGTACAHVIVLQPGFSGNTYVSSPAQTPVV